MKLLIEIANYLVQHFNKPQKYFQRFYNINHRKNLTLHKNFKYPLKRFNLPQIALESRRAINYTCNSQIRLHGLKNAQYGQILTLKKNFN